MVPPTRAQKRGHDYHLSSDAKPWPPLFAGGDLNYNVPAPTAEEHDRAQQVRGFLAQRSSMCVEFPGPTHRPTEQNDRSTRQLDAFAAPASAIWKWAVTPCWTDGQSDHAAIVASLHRRRTTYSGAMSPHLVKNLPSAALNDLRSRFGLLERLFGIPNRTRAQGLPSNTYNRPRAPGFPQRTPSSRTTEEQGLRATLGQTLRTSAIIRAIRLLPNQTATMTSLRLSS